MCGIAGYLQIAPDGRRPDPALIERMTEVLQHRGPDSRGIWCDGRVALGHRRLSIIDLSPNGTQPMGNEDGSIQIVYNGELYNYRELKRRFALAERGHQFRSQTDTEVLLHLYEELGMEMLRELNGMYAFALWDGGRQELHLVRDRYGIKPLFYTRHENCFLFASEIKSLLQHEGIKRQVNLQALHDFLTFGYVPGEQTAFSGIQELPPASCLSIRMTGETRMVRYWDLRFEVDDAIDEQTAVRRARELMDLAVHRQLVSDVPVGVLLSGGMDSSTVVALMAQHTADPIHTYSVGFEDPSFNELPAARLVAQQYRTIHREVCISPQIVRDLLPRYLTYIDEPYADGSAIPTYCVCQIAKKEVGVVLSGEGGDEAFGGYETYTAYKMSRWFRHVPRWVRQGVLAPAVNCLPVSHKKLSLEFKLKRFLGGQDLSPPQAHLWWRIILTEARKLALYTPEVLEQIVLAPADRHFIQAFNGSSTKDVLNKLMHIDSSIFLPDDLMIKNDRMSMAHSLEARVPMTDHDLTEFMARVPPKWKLRRLRKKHIMRTAMADLLPPAILNKKKVGLEMPYSRWLKHELHDLLMRYCGPQRLAETRLFRPEAVMSLIEEHVTQVHDHGRALWSLLNFMIWYEHYIAA
jgi:asparagine synthase (glutamine-hydrolysing)